MIRKTLTTTKEATFVIELPSLDPSAQGYPTPTGTGFFVSADGWFITAAHVVAQDPYVALADRKERTDIDQAWLRRAVTVPEPMPMLQWPSVVHVDHALDLALLKVDCERNESKEWLKQHSGKLPHLTVSRRPLDEGEPVYSHGYPLSAGEVTAVGPAFIGQTLLSPRTTSAVVASTLEFSGSVMTPHDPIKYVIDKALNYGNSGGPVIATETGRAHALCSRFQPMMVPQVHLKDPAGNVPQIMVPSLYGVVTSLSNPSFVAELESRGIEIVDG